MDLTLTEDQQLIQSTAREVLESRSGTAGARAVEGEAAGFSSALWKEMVELGWMGLGLPEEYGGLGLGFLETCLLIEEMGRFQVPSPFLSTVVCCGMPIVRFGTDAQKASRLGAIGLGRVMSYAVGNSEPSRITVRDSSDGFLLDGTAFFVPYADSAEELLVVAERSGRPIGFLVDPTEPGITRTRLDAVGSDPQFRVDFENVALSSDRVLGDSAEGQPVADCLSAYTTAATCAAMVGGAGRVLDMTIEYAGQREQFGRPIGSFQAVQHHCADMAMDVLSSRFISYEAIWRLSAGHDAAMEVSMAKAWAGEAYQRVCELGHQVHGAIGFTREHDLHYYLRHALSCASTFGDSDFHWNRVAERLGLSET